MTVTRTVPEIRVSEVRELLKNGVTRFRADDEGYGSIEERYALSPAGVRRLFQNEYLKGLKTVMPEFTLIVDVDDAPAPEDIEETPEEVHEVQALRDAMFAPPQVDVPTYRTALRPEDAAVLFAKLAQEAEDAIEKVESEDAITFGNAVDEAIMNPKEDSISDLFR